MPLVTVENKAAGLAQPNGSTSFGPVTQFTSTLSSELLLAPGSRVTLKRAKFLMNGDVFSVTPSNNKFAILLGYNGGQTPAPASYETVDTAVNGTVLHGEVSPGYYNGDMFALAIENAANAVLSSNTLFAAKKVKLKISYLENRTATGPGNDKFSIMLEETDQTVTILNDEFPSSIVLFNADDEADRTRDWQDYVADDANKSGWTTAITWRVLNPTNRPRDPSVFEQWQGGCLLERRVRATPQHAVFTML